MRRTSPSRYAWPWATFAAVPKSDGTGLNHAPQRALYKGHGTAVGSQITISAGSDLSPLPESTRVVWQGEANVFGKLASMTAACWSRSEKRTCEN